MTTAKVGPRDALERSVRKIWSDIIGHRDFGVHDNFFVLGGTSVGMLSVQQEISEICGCELSLAELFSAPTVAGAAVLMRGSARQEPSAIVPLAPDGLGPPLFCFHPLGGSAAVYFPLALSLSDRPVYGVQALGLTIGTAPHRTMSELTQTYLTAIRAVRPDGPYVLLGYSLGGIIAFAAAHEMQARYGERPLVVLIDTATQTRYEPADPYRAVGSYALNLELDYDEIARAGRERAIETIYAEALRVGVFGGTFPIERLAAIFDTALANNTAVADYGLRRYEGEVLLVESGVAGEQTCDWNAYAATLTRHAVALPHAMMLEEKAARRVAAILSAHLVTAAGAG